MWVTIGSGEGKGLSVRVEGHRFVIGSGEESQLLLDDPKVDPLHAYLQAHDDGRVELHDLGSDSGTFVDGERVEGSVTLHGVEEIRLGDTVLLATVEEPPHDATPVRATTEGEAVEVMPARERRRLREMSTAGLAAGALALVLAIAGVIVARSAGGSRSAAAGLQGARRKTRLARPARMRQ